MAMQVEQPDVMARRRALLTDRERELIADDDPDEENYRYQAISRVRNKIQDELPEDVDILEEHHPKLLGELREAVCRHTADVETVTKELEYEQQIAELEEEVEEHKRAKESLIESLAESGSGDDVDTGRLESSLRAALSALDTPTVGQPDVDTARVEIEAALEEVTTDE